MSIQARKALHLELPRDAKAAALARVAVAEIEGLAEGVADSLALLTTELVTNAVRHGRGAIRLAVTFAVGKLRVAVADEGGGFVAESALAIEGNAAGGFGLKIIDRLSDRWGVDRRHGVVWFELDLAAG
jgi:anti-sigma regulatory factor (Ser/Thr protein kinase)